MLSLIRGGFMARNAAVRKAPNNIAEARRAYEKRIGKKYTQEEAARDFKLGLSTYRNYEQEKSLPDGGVAAVIANKYGVTVDYLMGLSDVRKTFSKPSDELTDDEQELVKLYRGLSDKGKDAIIAGLRCYIDSES